MVLPGMKGLWLEPEAAAQVTSMVRKQREVNVRDQPRWSFVFSPGPQPVSGAVSSAWSSPLI